MSQHPERDAQNRLARIAGAMYLLTMATALFGEAYVRASLLTRESAAKTAQNIIESSQLFRIGLATDLITFIGVVVLVWSLHQLLKPVHPRLALLALMFRLVEIGVHVSAVVFGVVAVSFLAGGEYTRAFTAPQLHGLAGFALRAQGAGLTLGFLPLGLGSALFAYLFIQSGFVPRLLGAWGVFASLVLSAYAVAWVITPATTDFFLLGMVPMFIYEVGLGCWLLIQGVGQPGLPAGSATLGVDMSRQAGTR